MVGAPEPDVDMEVTVVGMPEQSHAESPKIEQLGNPQGARGPPGEDRDTRRRAAARESAGRCAGCGLSVSIALRPLLHFSPHNTCFRILEIFLAS